LSVSAGLVRADWPGSEDGLVFSFDNAHFRSRAVAYQESGAPIRQFALNARGQARYDRHHAVYPHNGWFEARRAGRFVIQSCRESGEFSVQAVITPLELGEETKGHLIALGEFVKPYLCLMQTGGQLVLALQSDGDAEARRSEFKLTRLDKPGEPVHAAITYDGNCLIAFLNGKEVFRDEQAGVNLQDWDDGELVFGGGPREKADAPPEHFWRGKLESIAWHSRALTAKEVQADSESRLKRIAEREQLPALRVRATLHQRSENPDIRQIAPYVRALAVYEYIVEEVLQGEHHQPLIRVAHWTIMEKQTLPIADRPVGGSCELTLEPFEAQPQLTAEWLSDTLDISELQLYYDIDIP